MLKSCAHRRRSLAHHEARHHPAVQLPTQALAEEIHEDGIFALSSPFGLGKSCLRLIFNLQYFNNAIYSLAHTYTVYFLITIFSMEKILDKKILAILWQSAKFAKIFSLQNFVSYGSLFHSIVNYHHCNIFVTEQSGF